MQKVYRGSAVALPLAPASLILQRPKLESAPAEQYLSSLLDIGRNKSPCVRRRRFSCSRTTTNPQLAAVLIEKAVI
jgi:hypothetical protein